MKPGLVCAALVAITACHRGDATPSVDASASVAVVAAAASAQSAPAPPRCARTPGGLALVDAGAQEDLEVGDAVPYSGGLAIDVVHRTTAGRIAAVALVSPDATAARLVDLGPALGDAPPPRAAPHGKGLLVASYSASKRSRARELTVYAVGDSAQPAVAATLEQQHDDSFAFDLSPSLVTWDDVAPGPPPRSVVRAAEIGEDGRLGPTRDLSLDGVEAEAPRIVAAGQGALLVWIANAPEPAAPTSDGSTSEVAGEARVPEWLEMVALDAHGVPTGPVRRITPPGGHVSSFDVVLPGDTKSGRAIVVARDDGEAVDGSGGRLLRIAVRDDGADPPIAYDTDGLGRGPPSLVGPSASWLSWDGPREETWLLPLDAAGMPAGKPSVEPELDDARVLAPLPGGRLLAAAPDDTSSQLRVLTCRL